MRYLAAARNHLVVEVPRCRKGHSPSLLVIDKQVDRPPLAPNDMAERQSHLPKGLIRARTQKHNLQRFTKRAGFTLPEGSLPFRVLVSMDKVMGRGCKKAVLLWLTHSATAALCASWITCCVPEGMLSLSRRVASSTRWILGCGRIHIQALYSVSEASTQELLRVWRRSLLVGCTPARHLPG